MAPNPTQSLIEAIEAGNLKAARKAIAAGADVNGEWDDETPLIMAARDGRLEIVKVLLAAGADPNQWVQGDTALTAAHRHGQRDVFWYLWTLADEDARRHVDEQSAEEGGPAEGAAEPAVAPPLYQAVAEGRVDDVRALLAGGAGPNERTSLNETPLHEALRKGYEDIALALIRAGADPNASTSDEQAPLVFAADRGYAAVVRALVEAGANVNRKDGGETALQAAARAQRDDVYAYLEPLVNSKVRAAGRRARTAAWRRSGGPLSPEAQLARAAEEGRLARARELLAGGADPNALSTGFGESALHQAAMRGDPALVRLLLEGGADPRLATEAGVTALHRAVPRLEVMRPLLAADADPNARQKDGETPLHWAAMHRDDDAWRILVEAGADPALADAEGHTPDDIRRRPPEAALEALDAAFDDVERRLRERGLL